ncbi:MAG: hypothetical protein AMJ53_09235 [Gammaproteobacteria bacterium SG8_11]|nr:MAG: hypothetical protein AMJ53_09235 [Gammaproteobacteria bacterium SG8_11]
MLDQRTEEAITLMNHFAERTGLTSTQPAKRYLWTDAFAVCNFLSLAHLTGDQQYTQLALRLVDQVHHTLGKHRSDDSRSGWISGLSEQAGEQHPTQGGLRIGKTLPERGPKQAFDEQLEWERDGQYFHYLTKWMHALDQVTRSTGQPQFNRWARELAATAYQAFTYSPSCGAGPRRMYWKMSIDLKRALVPSMGQHDPLDGYITNVQLISSAIKLPHTRDEMNLANELGQWSAMIREVELATADPLGIGGLLIDAYRVDQLLRQGAEIDKQLLESLLSAALKGLQYYVRRGELQLSAQYRLAFRELGLAIGLHAVQLLKQTADRDAKPSHTSAAALTHLKTFMEYTTVRDKIESFWRNPHNRLANTWSEHRDINEVMLATVLAPEGFLVLVSHRD